jgi:dihydrofolate synthase/folylpolyglutamate synthase
MTQSLKSYQENLAWLYGLQRFGIKLGLENITRLLRELGVASAASRGSELATASLRPDWQLTGWQPVPQPPRVIHVAGTNGKGSVCAMADSICRAHGSRVGLFTSPHLITFRERIQVNGQLISEEQAAQGLARIRQLIAGWDVRAGLASHPTFFEVTTALALEHFRDANVHMVILETGLGGRLDATNAVPSTVSVITPIDFDHQKWLGDSIEKIAAEKAGIIKPNTPVVSARQIADAERVIRARAAECKAPIQFVAEPYDKAPILLRGAHQKQNAALAIAALTAARIELSESTIARGLMSVEWPARFQRLNDRIIIDGAHNPAAARVLAQTWRETFGDCRATIILAVLSDKDVRGIGEALAPIADYIFLPPIRSERALPPKDLAEALSAITPKLQYSITRSLAGAITSARERSCPILLTGSLHFAGEALAYLQGRPAAFEECKQ